MSNPDSVNNGALLSKKWVSIAGLAEQSRFYSFLRVVYKIQNKKHE